MYFTGFQNKNNTKVASFGKYKNLRTKIAPISNNLPIDETFR